MVDNLIIRSELGPEFIDDEATSKVRLKLGSGLALQPDGTITATGSSSSSGGGNAELPEQVVCKGNFSDVSTRSGSLHNWTESYSENSGTIIEDWVRIGGVEVSPDCLTDLTVNGTFGNSYIQARNMWGRAWFDVRLMINDVAVNTYTLQCQHYSDNIGSTNFSDDSIALGSFHFARASVAAKAEIAVEIARRHNFTAGPASVVAPLGRVLSGSRAHYNVLYVPVEVVTGRE